MGSPLVGVVCFAVVFVGIVLVAQGSFGREPQLFRGVWGEASTRDGVHYPAERHPRRLVGIGLGLVVLGVVLAVAWGSLV